jgi:hypothetical protein
MCLWTCCLSLFSLLDRSRISGNIAWEHIALFTHQYRGLCRHYIVYLFDFEFMHGNTKYKFACAVECVSPHDMDTIWDCGGFYWFHLSINFTECARPSLAASPVGSDSGRQVRHIRLHRTVSQIQCDETASNWTINICVFYSAFGLQHLTTATKQ